MKPEDDGTTEREAGHHRTSGKVFVSYVDDLSTSTDHPRKHFGV